jgi:ferredoxin
MQVNKDICIGCGACVAVSEDIFQMKDGKSELIKTPTTEEEIAQFKVGQASCPV